jgi:hypothetical protein
MSKSNSNPTLIEPSIKNIEDLRRQTLEVLDELRAGTMKHYTAKEFTNGVGKVIGSIKCELEYAALRREVPYIPFLHGLNREAEPTVLKGERLNVIENAK